MQGNDDMIIYKYFALERIDILKTLLIRFTQPSALNDPYECLPTIDDYNADILVDGVIGRHKALLLDLFKSPEIIKQQRNEIAKKLKTNPHSLKLIAFDKYREHRDKVGILSLTKRGDSVVMWSHYAKKHTGFVLGFNSEHNFFNQLNHSDINSLREVNYSPNRMKLSIEGEININPEILLTKGMEWQYEQEMRLIARLASAPRVISTVNSLCYMFPIPPDAIVKIVFGMNCDRTNSEKHVQYIRATPTLKHIMAYQAELDEKSFLMKQVEIK